MSKELAKEEISSEIINSLILTGDMSKLSATQQTQYYNAVCKSVGINPLTQPFAIIVLQGKKTLYATKGCTQQLSDTRKINTEIKKKETIDSVYVADCRATMPDGRYTDDIGAVSIVGLKGAELANAMMKAITKAKRRAVLALCGLGMPDETEVEDITQHPAAAGDPTKSRVENIIEATAEEVTSDAPKTEEKIKHKTTKEPEKDKDKDVAAKKDSPLTVSGLIEETPKVATVQNPATDKPGIKHSFKIGDKYYGTFDTALAKGIMECVDKRILVKFTYTERDNSDKTKKFQDIVSFSQVTADEVPI